MDYSDLAAIHYQQQLEAQQEFEEALSNRLAKLAQKFSYMANHVPQYQYTEELIEAIENCTDDLWEGPCSKN
jgi:hypothetical protein